MRSKLRPVGALALLSTLLIASGCAHEGSSFRPSAADLTPAEPPAPTVEILADDTASASYNEAIERIGELNYKALGRLCRMARDSGVKAYKKLDCPKP